ncbi:MAG: hypothetical protein AB1626_01190 [Candidatus Micrarchaeota archaeon]
MEIEPRKTVKKKSSFKPPLYGPRGEELSGPRGALLYDARGRPIIKHVKPVATAEELEAELRDYEKRRRAEGIELSPEQVKAVQALVEKDAKKGMRGAILRPHEPLVKRAQALEELERITEAALREAARLERQRTEAVAKMKREERKLVV